MNYTPFQDIANNINTIFNGGLTQVTSNALSAVSGPLMATVMLWIIIQGILVMRGDMDARGGITRIIRVAIVVELLTSAGLYNTYVATTFQTTLPNWVASSVAGSATITNTPQAFDQIWNTTVHEIDVVQSQVDFYDVVDQISLSAIEMFVNVLLVIHFAIYEIALVLVAIVVAVGPFVVAGYLFDATKRVAENWVGKLVGLTILTLLVNIVVTVILKGEQLYTQSIVNNPAFGTGAVPVEVQILFELCMFFGISAFIVVLLPGIAAAIGGGIGFDVSRMVRSAAGMVMSGAGEAVASTGRAGYQAGRNLVRHSSS
jgi:type IV secretion system protein VirB6